MKSTASPSPSAAGVPGPDSAPYVWFVSSILIVLALDQAGDIGTIPSQEQFHLLDLGLAAAVAVTWLRGWRWWPAVAMAGLISGFIEGYGILGAPLYATGLAGGAVCTSILLSFCGFDSRMRNVTDVLALAFLAGPGGALVSAVLAAILPLLARGEGLHGVGERFLAEWLSGWTGILMLTPFIFSLSAEYFRRWNTARMWEWILVNLLLTACMLAMMYFLTDNTEHWYPLAYLALPCIFWTAWRFGPAGAALANLFVGGVTALSAMDGDGPFAGGPDIGTMFMAWSFLGFHGLTALLLAALTDERRLESMQQRQRARFFRQVIEQLPCGVLLKDISDKPLLVNRKWFQLFGRPGGTEDDQWKHQQTVEPFWRAREMMLLQNLNEIFREETESTNVEGQHLELLLTKQAAYYDERAERLLMVVAEDVTGGRHSLREARNTIARIRATLAVAEVGMWDWHIPTGIIHFDEQFSKLTGVVARPEGISVAEWQKGIHPEDREQFQHAMLRHLHHQAELFATRYRFHRTDSWVWLVVRGRVVEQDVRKLGVRMIGTLQEARATVQPLPDPNVPAENL